jgi:hypothetical protein
MNNINQIIKNFFVGINLDKNHEVSVVRADGIVIYSTVENYMDRASIGALISGLWQAALSLSNYIDKDADGDKFRLGFDTSVAGVNVLPLKINGKEFFVCSLFKECLNPAKLKQKMKLTTLELESYVKKEFIPQENNAIERTGYLFDSITDKEMDQLFNF